MSEEATAIAQIRREALTGGLTLAGWQIAFDLWAWWRIGGLLTVLVSIVGIIYVYNKFLNFLFSFSTIQKYNLRPVWIILGFTALSLLSIIFLYACLFRRFGIADNDNVTYNLGACIYFSVITITTVGYGDYHPAYALSRLVACFEALSGYIILGILVASLSNMLRSK